MRETRVQSGRGLSEESGGGRGIASGAKIRFARCRLHPRSIANHPPAPFEPSARHPLPPLTPRVDRSLARYAAPASHPLSPSATVPRKLERAPPFDPADSHPPQPSAATHPPIRRPNSIPYGLQVVSSHPLANPSTVSFSATRYDISVLAPLPAGNPFLALSFLPSRSLSRALLEDTGSDKYATGGPRGCRRTCVVTRLRSRYRVYSFVRD